MPSVVLGALKQWESERIPLFMKFTDSSRSQFIHNTEQHVPNRYRASTMLSKNTLPLQHPGHFLASFTEREAYASPMTENSIPNTNASIHWDFSMKLAKLLDLLNTFILQI